MLWTLLFAGFAGLTLGIICTVHVMVLASIVTVVLTAIVALQSGLSLMMGCAAVWAALMILQACYLVGASIGVSAKSAKETNQAARPLF